MPPFDRRPELDAGPQTGSRAGRQAGSFGGREAGRRDDQEADAGRTRGASAASATALDALREGAVVRQIVRF